MVTFLVISKHAPEDCPLRNEKMKKLALEYLSLQKDLEKKYKVKKVGVWSDIPEHTLYMIYEAPTAEDFQKSLMEPVIMQTILNSVTQIKTVMSDEESMKLLK